MKQRHCVSPAYRFRLRPHVLAFSVIACFAAVGSHALPSGPQIAAGAATISQNGNMLNISNAAGTIINWNTFSIGAQEGVRFSQPSALSSVLNRVTGSASSQILGELSSNGRVWLLNPNGILLGPGSRIDVNGLIASTLNVSNEDFLAGRMKFGAGETAGNLYNAGTLSAAENIYLIAPDVTNSGIIRSTHGEVLLAAGRQVQLVEGAHPDIQVMLSAPEDRAINLGEIAAGRISVFGALVQQHGTMNADRVEVDDYGRVVLRASVDTVIDGGTVSARHGNNTGGRIEVLGNRIAVMGDALLDVSGAQGGGTILVGGDYQGKNPALTNARVSYFGPEATLKANAEKAGAGGTIIVWAEDSTRAYGRIEARGGAAGGDGGLVETSAHHLGVDGIRVDTRAQLGKAGQWLVDPLDVHINSSNSSNGSWTTDIFTPSGTPSNVDVADIIGNLANGGVTITTVGTVGGEAGTIFVDSPLNYNSTNTLTLNAAGDIKQDANIVNGGSGNITLSAVGSITMGTLGADNTVRTQTAGGTITYSTSTGNGGTVSLGRLDAGSSGSIFVIADNQILDNNVGGLNAVGSLADFNSRNGATSGLAISADTNTSSLRAVSYGDTNNDIDIRNSSTSLSIGQIAGSNVNLTTTGNLYVGPYDGPTIRATNALTIDVGTNLTLDGQDIYGGTAGIMEGIGSVAITLGGIATDTLNIVNGATVSSGTSVTTGNNSITFTNLSSGGVSEDGSGRFSRDGFINEYNFTQAVANGTLMINYQAIPASNYSVSTLLLSGAASHSYGQTPTASLGYSLSATPPQGEVISGTPVFTPSLSNQMPAGTFTILYSTGLSSSVGSTFVAGAGLTYTVNPAVLTAVLNDVSKVYDGNAIAALAPGNFLLSGFATGEGASVTQTSGTYASRNAGTNIAVSTFLNPDHFSPVGGARLSNYVLPTSASGLGSIAQRPNVTWIGSSSGNWSLATNWEAGALPDFANVATVTLPAGTTVNFDGLDVLLDSLQSAGLINLQGGTLAISNHLTTAGYRQSGGLLTGLGRLTVSSDFGKSGGSIALGGPISITQATGDLIFINNQPVVLGPTMALTGNINVDVVGGITSTGPISAPAGTVTLAAHSPLQIDSPVSAQGNVTLFASDNLTQNANVSSSSGSVAGTAETGSISMLAGVATQASSINYAAPSGNIQLALLNGSIMDLTTGGNLTSTPGHTDLNLLGGIVRLQVGGDALLRTNVLSISGSVGGTLYLINNGVPITNLSQLPTAIQGTLEMQIACLIDRNACLNPGAGNSSAQEVLGAVQLTQQTIKNTTTPDEDEVKKDQTTGLVFVPATTQGIGSHATPNYCN